MRHVKVNGVEVAYTVVGRGEPILFIHGAHIADAMRPLVEDPVLDGFQRIRYHRRGVGGSSCPPRRGRQRSPCTPMMPSGSSSISKSIVLT